MSDDNTASAPDAARGAILPASDTPGGYADADADVLRGRIAALEAVSAENERLRAEVERLRAQRDKANSRTLRMWERAKAAEAKLRDVEALADEWTREAERIQEFADRHQGYYLGVVGTRRSCRDHLRAVLARSQAPQAPAEHGCCDRCGNPPGDALDSNDHACPQAPAEQEGQR